MEGKFFWAFALVGILVVIGPAAGCKICGHPWCSCGGGIPQLPSISRSWHMERPQQMCIPPPPPVELSLPVIEQQPSFPSVCRYCGGYNRGYHGYSPRSEASYNRGGFYCRCSPRGHRHRYEDY